MDIILALRISSSLSIKKFGWTQGVNDAQPRTILGRGNQPLLINFPERGRVQYLKLRLP
jgi:hypothetical protein